MTNVILTDLGVSIRPKFLFENFMDKCVSASEDSAIYCSTLFEMFHLPLLLSYFHRQIQGVKSFGNVKQAGCLVCGKP